MDVKKDDEDVAMADAESTVDPQQELHRKRRELFNAANEEYQWLYLTSDVVDDFDRSRAGIALKVSSQPGIAQGVFYEVILSAKYYEARIPRAKLVSLLEDVMGNGRVDVLKSTFIAVLNSFKLDENILKLLREYKSFPSVDLASFALDEKIVTELGLVQSLSKDKMDYLIRHLVDQPRYNLLHESAEGYSKVITILSDVAGSEFSKFQVSAVLNSIDICIGHFNLDTTMVLNLIICIGAEFSTVNYRFFLELLENSQWFPKVKSEISSLESLNEGGSEDAVRFIASNLRVLAKTPSSDEELKRFMRFTCMLMKIGFISFGALYKLLGPSSEVMLTLSEKIKQNIDEEIFKASANALALSGPLADDEDDEEDNKTQSTESQEKSAEQCDVNFKLLLLKSLLENGLYFPSLYILVEYPTLAFADDEVPKLILRIFKHMIEPFLCQEQILSEEQSRKLTTPLVKDLARHDDIKEVSYPLSNGRFVCYFYREWTEGLPSVENEESLIKYSNEFLSFVGAKLGEDFLLVSKICKAITAFLKKTKNSKSYEKELETWFEYYRKFIFPALSFGHENPILVHDSFQLLVLFPVAWRYNLYGELLRVTSKNNQFVKLNYSKAEKQTKDVLKRLTTTNVKETMRRLAKIAFANPLPAFSVILNQIESYDNLTDLVVDSARYFNDYAWDVLPFAILTRLTQRRQALQDDGINDSTWLQSLSVFIGKISKHYKELELDTILMFCTRSLHHKDRIGLTVLKQLIAHMGGIQRYTNLIPSQIKFLNSGLSLQKVTRKTILDTRDESINSGLRLINSMRRSGDLNELFILLHNYHVSVIRDSDDTIPFKVLCDHSDESAAVLHTFCQMITFFSHSANYDLFQHYIAPLDDMISEYNIGVAWAFELWRSKLPLEFDANIESTSIDLTDLSKTLFNDFWKLSLYDINFDADVYTTELAKVTAQNKSIEKEVKITLMDIREKNSRENVRLRERLQKSHKINNEVINGLPRDLEKHRQHSELISNTIDDHRPLWFSSEEPTENEIEAFIQFCVIPRVTHSESGAIFSATFISTQLSMSISKAVLNKLFESGILGTLLYSSTPIEAENIGLFVGEVIGSFQRKSEVDLKKSSFHWLQEIVPVVKNNLIYVESYMARRNTLTFLKNLIPMITTKTIGISLHSIVEEVGKIETRDDLKLACSAVFALLQGSSKNWVNIWDVVELDEQERSLLEAESEKLLRRQKLVKEEEKRLLAKKAEEERAIRLAEIKAQEAERNARRAEEEAAAAALREKEITESEQKDSTDEAMADADEEVDEEEIIIEEDDEKQDTKSSSKIALSGEEPEIKDPKQPDPVSKATSSGEHESELKKNDIKTGEIPKREVQVLKENKPKENLKFPTEPQNAAKDTRLGTRFRNVTADMISLSETELQKKIKDVVKLIREKDMEGLIKFTSDSPSTSKKLRENNDPKTFRKNVKLILHDYFVKIAGHPVAVDSFLQGPLSNLPLPEAHHTRQRLPDQSFVVSKAIAGKSDRTDDWRNRDSDRRDRDRGGQQRDNDKRDPRRDRDRDGRPRDRDERPRDRDGRPRDRDERPRDSYRRDDRGNRGSSYKGSIPPPPPPPPPAKKDSFDTSRGPDRRDRRNDYPDKRRRRL